MKTTTLPLVLAGAVAASGTAALAQSPRPELAAALQQVEQGEFDAALLGLDGIIRSLTGAAGASKDLAQAYLFQGIAYVGLDQTEKARASFRQALTLDKGVTLNRERFAPKIVQVFEEVRQAVHPAKSKTGLVLLGVAAAAGGGAAVALSGGDSPSGPALDVAVQTLAGTTPVGASDDDCRETLYRFTMTQAGTVTVDGQSVSDPLASLLATLCVGTVSGREGSDCAQAMDVKSEHALRRDMSGGTHTAIVWRGSRCTLPVQYSLRLTHPR